MRTPWLAAATIAAAGLALAGCSSSGSGTATPATTTTAAPTTTVSTTDATASSTTSATSATGTLGAPELGSVFMQTLNIPSTTEINTCLGNKFLGDASLTGVVRDKQKPTNEQTVQIYQIVFDCGVEPSAFAPLFTKGVANSTTLTDAQTQCVTQQFSALSREDIITLLSQPTGDLGKQLGVKLASTCGITDPIPTTTAA